MESVIPIQRQGSPDSGINGKKWTLFIEYISLKKVLIYSAVII